MQPDSGEEEGNQQFRDSMRQVADALTRRFRERQAGQERADDRRHSDVDGRQREREQQAHRQRELRFPDAQLLIDMRHDLAHRMRAPLGDDHGERRPPAAP